MLDRDGLITALKQSLFRANQTTHRVAALTNSTKRVSFKRIQESKHHKSSKVMQS